MSDGVRGNVRNACWRAALALAAGLLSSTLLAQTGPSPMPVLPADDRERPVEDDLNYAHPRFEEPSTESHLFQDWRHVRTNLVEGGFTPSLSFVSDVQGNPLGGESQGLTAFSGFNLDLDFDLDRLVGWEGGEARLSGTWRFGGDLSGEYIHNVFIVAQEHSSEGYRLLDCYFQQAVADERFDVRLGRMAVGDEFVSLPIYDTYVQDAIAGSSVGIFFNAPGMTSSSATTWGIRLRTRPAGCDNGFYAMVGAFDGDQSVTEGSKHGVDWSMNGPPFAVAETGYWLNHGQKDQGLPGEYRLGGWYDDHDFMRFVPGALHRPNAVQRGNTGLYALLQQMIYRQGDDPHSKRGVTPFASIHIAPDQDVSTMPFFLNGGVQYRGPIPGRDDDIAALAVVYGAFSDQLQRAQSLSGVGVQNHETVLEWTYRINVRPWFYVQPDVQYIFRPRGTGSFPNALVLGTQVAINF
jgi:porin